MEISLDQDCRQESVGKKFSGPPGKLVSPSFSYCLSEILAAQGIEKSRGRYQRSTKSAPIFPLFCPPVFDRFSQKKTDLKLKVS
jgi:hypothetical protein